MRKLTLLLLVALLSARTVLSQATTTPTMPPTLTASPTEVPTDTRTPSITPTIPPTPAPAIEGFAVDGGGEVIFPEAIHFTLTLSRPASEIRDVRLTIDTEAGVPFMPEFDLDEILHNAEPQAFLAYDWLLPEDAIPPLFSTIEFTWEVEAVDGETARLEGIVEFKDQRVVWVTNQVIPDQLTMVTVRDVPTGLVQSVRMVYELLSQNTNRSPELRFLVYDASVAPGCIHRTVANEDEETVAIAPYSGATLSCRTGFAEQVYEQGGYAVFQRAPGFEVETAMVEYMVREFYNSLWDGSDVPSWFEAGLGLFYAPVPKTDLLSVVQTMARNNRQFSLEAMTGAPPDNPELVELWRAQSYSMLLYLVDQVGVQGVFELANTLGDGESFSELYAQMTGESLQALIPAWQGWIFTRSAELVYGITPYQPPTATYTATFTDTATRIPTATLTPSQTYTPSVTGVLSPTPYPTLTSSVTPTPEPPTVTPRSPQRTPTPTPTSSIGVFGTAGVQAGVIVVLLIVIGILVYAYIRLGRR